MVVFGCDIDPTNLGCYYDILEVVVVGVRVAVELYVFKSLCGARTHYNASNGRYRSEKDPHHHPLGKLTQIIKQTHNHLKNQILLPW